MPDTSEAVETVRLLISDVDTDTTKQLLTDVDVERFLALEGGNVKLAAAQAMDAIASSEALAGKVIRTAAGTSTDGAKLADALRKHATALRAQVTAQVDADDDGYFSLVDSVPRPHRGPELTGWDW